MKNTLIILSLMILIGTSFVFDSAYGMGTVWRGINKAGSSVIDMGDVAGGYTDGQIMRYQSSNNTFIPYTLSAGGNATNSDDLGDYVVSGLTQFSIMYYNGVNWANKIFKLNEITCAADTWISNIQNDTDSSCSGITAGSIDDTELGTGITVTQLGDGSVDNTEFGRIGNLTSNVENHFTSVETLINTKQDSLGYNPLSNIVSTPATTAKLIQDNSTSTKVSLKTLTQGTGISITNNTSDIVIASTVVDTTGITSIASGVATANNATLVADNSTQSNKITMKTLSAGLGITLINNTNSVQLNVTNGFEVLSVGNLTSSVTGSGYTQIWRIPLTANSGNYINGQIIVTSNTLDTAPQFTANVTNGNTFGTCTFQTPTTTGTTAPTIDIFAMNSSNPSIDTAETVFNFVAGTAVAVKFDCTLTTSATAGDLRVFFQSENTNTVNVKDSSYFTHTP